MRLPACASVMVAIRKKACLTSKVLFRKPGPALSGLIVAALLALTAAVLMAPGAAVALSSDGKLKIGFTIGQAFENGLVEHPDLKAIDNIIASLTPLEGKFDVFVIVDPENISRVAAKPENNKVDRILKRFAKAGIPFVLDVYSSDANTLGGLDFNAPCDRRHGLIFAAGEACGAVGVDTLQSYRNRFGAMFAGIRVDEVFHQDWTIRQCRGPNPEWCRNFRDNLPSDAFYQPQYLQAFLKFAYANGMFVILSDLHWYAIRQIRNYVNDRVQEGYERDLNLLKWLPSTTALSETRYAPVPPAPHRGPIEQFPGTVILTYANNSRENSPYARPSLDSCAHPTYTCDDHLITWLAAYGGNSSLLGYGLSDQSWACIPDSGSPPDPESHCPVEYLEQWLRTALAQRAQIDMVQFEPTWYFWSLPRGMVRNAQPKSAKGDDSASANDGAPTPNLRRILEILGQAH
jgi:hypothetical protein